MDRDIVGVVEVEPRSSSVAAGRLAKRAEEFVGYLRGNAEYSPRTAEAYGSDLRQFLRYISAEYGGIEPEAITAAMMQLYKEGMARLSPATVSRRLAAISALFNWLWLRGEVSSNPCMAVKRPRRRPADTRWVTAEDSIALLAACRDDRERAILATYLRGALRYTELVSLRLQDFDPLRNELTVQGKGGLRRTVPVLSDLRPYLMRWLVVRSQVDHDFLFTARTGCPLYDKACWRLFRRLLRRAGLMNKGYTIHSLRHGAATQMYEAGVDLGTIARFLRHSDMSTVGRYVHAGTDVIRRQIEERLHGGELMPIPSPVPEAGIPWPVIELAVAVAQALSCVPWGDDAVPVPATAA